MELDVQYSDNHIVVVNKPACVPMVPDETGDESLFEAVGDWIQREYQKPGRAFVGVVHRLDRPVSGVVLFARTSKAAKRLTEQFRDHAAEKIYWGLTRRVPDPPRGEIEQWLRKDRGRNRVHVVAPSSEGSKRARTKWRTLRETGAGASRRVLVELRPQTGRSHQLRVASASLGAPLLGDLKYGADKPLMDKSIGLHARSLGFRHPTRGEELVFQCDPPALDVWRFPADSG